MFESVIKLEKSLLDYETRSDLAKLRKLLHDDFVEFGSSGKVYNKQEILDSLPYEQKQSKLLEIKSVETRKLSDSCTLLTYKLFSNAKLHSTRSSIWLYNLCQRQLLFHQGTPC